MSDSPTQVIVTPKPWWESKTNWYNLGKGILGFATLIIGFLIMSQQQGTLPFTIDPKWLAFGAGLVALLDGTAGIYLRSVTDQPVTRGKPQ